MRSLLVWCLAAWFFTTSLAVVRSAGQTEDMQQDDHSAMSPGPTKETGQSPEEAEEGSFIQQVQQHTIAGTDAQPNSSPSQMLMVQRGRWRLMLHGQAFLNEMQQTGPRGGDKLFSTNWIMPMAQRRFGNGSLTLRTMFSLEPATVSQRRYPELFQQGETAFGHALVDGQHPHDFIMEIAALYDYRLTEDVLLSFYAGAVGDPAMGPAAYPHRESASEDPIAPLGHHLQDSTHIADDVITAGVTFRKLRVEASGFHGREPDENRWNIDSGGIDSWSARLTVNAARNWSAQYSIARLHSPEAIAASDDLRRMTASVSYNRPLRNGNWASTLLWGRNQSLTNHEVGNSYLAESTVRFLERNYAWVRIENVDRTNELLQAEGSVLERYFARVQAYTGGYDRDIGHVSHLTLALGGQMTWYGVPDTLQPLYGAHPVGWLLFLRIRTRE